jgi:Glycosyl hydrolases family 2, sugar binding domain/Glycosyl hydrolases family 2/Glycosyl hydrolases family 2, TIM barrel domain
VAERGTRAVTVPRAEYPRPQFVRDDWLCLNGPWQFEVDAGDTGIESGLLERELATSIVVPFCLESELSGIGETGFVESVWYRRDLRLPQSWAGDHVLLHFQAVDHDATVWVDGRELVRHRGGWAPFTAELPDRGDRDGELTVVVRARDRRRGPQARGKQSDAVGNYGCMYTRTTGIWQTVWLERVRASYMHRPRITSLVSEGAFHVDVSVRRPRRGLVVRCSLIDDHELVSSAQAGLGLDFSVRLVLPIPATQRRLWSPEDPFLYRLELDLVDEHGDRVDHARSYAGLRSIAIDGRAVLLNGEPVFQRLVLDQGYYPDGVMTAPTDEALVRDIELSKAAGFNGARLHQKVFEERFLYHCDRLGYLVWGEFGDWGARSRTAADPQQPTSAFIAEWLEVLDRDYSHPAIVGWCPLNETAQTIHDEITVLDDVTRAMFLATKAADGTRPVLDASGYAHRVPEADIYDAHSYEQDPRRLAELMDRLQDDLPFVNGDADDVIEMARSHAGIELEPGRRDSRQLREIAAFVRDNPPGPWSIPFAGQPYFLSEFGGIAWMPDGSDPDTAWGYGPEPLTREEFYERFEGLVGVLLANQKLFGYCYTQLTDTYQERNGIYDFHRTPKFDLRRIHAAQRRPAAIEAAHGGRVRGK